SRSWDRTIHDQAKPHTSPRSSMYARDSNGTDGGCSRIVWTTQKSVTRRTVLQSPRLDASLTPGCDGFVRLEEAARVLHHLVDVLLRIFPGIDDHLGLRGEAGHLHRDFVRMRWHVVRRYQQRRLDGAHEIARHGEHEVGAVGV